MAREKIFSVLDVGSSEIVCLVARKSQREDGIEVLGIGTSNSFGIRKGTVCDIEEASNSIGKAISNAEQSTGVQISEVTVGLKGNFISSVNSFGGVAISSFDEEIDISDVERAVESTKKVAVPYGSEIIHVLPRSFTVDGQTGIRNPIGMSGLKLEVESHIVMGSTPVIRNIEKSIEKAGVSVASFVISSIASGYGILSQQQRELGCMILDIGCDGVGISIFEDGEVSFTGFSPVGSGHITRDISVGIKTTYNIAESIKIKYGNSDPFDVSDEETFTLSEFGDDNQIVSKKYIAQIINPRVREILRLVMESVSTYSRNLVLPAGIVLIGGGAELKNIAQVAKKVMNLPVQIGYPSGVFGIVDMISRPKYCVVSSIAEWVAESPMDFSFETKALARKEKKRRNKGPKGSIFDWFKNFLP